MFQGAAPCSPLTSTFSDVDVLEVLILFILLKRLEHMVQLELFPNVMVVHAMCTVVSNENVQPLSAQLCHAENIVCARLV
mmetsp:Transcript_18381/g.48978  ORF Transcript_18381/g.48978 Transcript_18381/m.48978 type:complete len:80 (-) Transcript_18381:74-313(-)